MHHNTEPNESIAACLYQLNQIRRMDAKPDPFRLERTLHAMLIVREAEGSVTVDGRRYILQPKQILFIRPGADVRLSLSAGRPADYFDIRFHALRVEERGNAALAAPSFPAECVPAPFPYLFHKAEEMEKLCEGNGRWAAMRASILLQELIVALFGGDAPDRKNDLDQAIHRTLDYMDKHYAAVITREKLAGMSGLSADYYSREFKKRTGKSPMDYLTEIRINRAKQMLLHSGASFRAIARNVGLSDEFYFSRKFKAKVGCSPMAYVKKFKSAGKIASLNHLTTGHFIALNIEPYAAVLNHAYPVAARLRNTISVGYTQPDLEKLVSAKPDLIVTHAPRFEGSSPKEQLLHQIAPTIALHFFDDWRTHLRTLAKIVGKEPEAEEWLERYERKAETARERILNALGEETCLIVGVGDGRMCVYGTRNMGAVLYGDLHIAMPQGVGDIDHYREIAPAELEAFGADRILLTTFKHDGTPHMDETIERSVSALYASSQWRELPAVRNGKVHAIYEGRHLYTSYNALSHDLLLDKLQHMIAGAER